MIKSIEMKPRPAKLEIDLTGPEGNAFYLLGTARKLARQMGYDADEIVDEMTVGDYENLLEVFDKYFGTFVILYR